MAIPRSEVLEVLPPGGPGQGQAPGRAAGDVENQIRSRDYRLVEDTSFLVAYRPVFNGKKSDGVEAEIKHAKEFGRRVIAYHPPQDSAGDRHASSPFGSNVITKAGRGEFIGYVGKVLGTG